ncbi:MAG: C45 family peptidase [Tannerellaceae bacterium]|nr:C45 family peptidase [Tannerellaceae bacterium]
MKKLFIILMAMTMLPTMRSVVACTTIIISGKATKDGRPLMWKNADTDNLNHRLIYSDRSGYPLIGVARSSSPDEHTASIWIGTNSEGFSIMNTLSYNLTNDRDASRNGSLMRRALEKCRNVADFKHFLDTLSRPMKVEANFGVIDAEGNAAYFETYTNGYHIVDVNDPAIAPQGYLVYTNFSYNGFYEAGEGYIRYLSTQRLIARQAPARDYSPQWIFTDVARSYYHSLMDVDFRSEEALRLFSHGYIPDSDFIPRKSTASSTVVQGVRKGERPELTTMWVIPGYPPCSVALPSWVKAGNDNPPLLMKYDDKNTSRLCDWALAAKEEVFPVKRGHGQSYLDMTKLYNKEGTGYIQKLAPVEARVFGMITPLLAAWREAGSVDREELKAAAKAVSDYVEQSLAEVR